MDSQTQQRNFRIGDNSYHVASVLKKKKNETFLSFVKIDLVTNILNICSNVSWLVIYSGIDFWVSSVKSDCVTVWMIYL